MTDLADLLSSLAACLCASLTDDGQDGPGLCFCGVEPGAVVIADTSYDCREGCGMAWVRLAKAYPAVSPGTPDNSDQPCGQFLGADIEMGVLRCLPIPDDGSGPSADELESAALQAVADMLTMRAAVMCCSALTDVPYRLGQYTPVGPAGAVIGGTWTISVAI